MVVFAGIILFLIIFFFVGLKDALVNVVNASTGKEKVKRESILWILGLGYGIGFIILVYELAT